MLRSHIAKWRKISNEIFWDTKENLFFRTHARTRFAFRFATMRFRTSQIILWIVNERKRKYSVTQFFASKFNKLPYFSSFRQKTFAHILITHTPGHKEKMNKPISTNSIPTYTPNRALFFATNFVFIRYST